jgi:hypothetical protein
MIIVTRLWRPHNLGSGAKSNFPPHSDITKLTILPLHPLSLPQSKPWDQKQILNVFSKYIPADILLSSRFNGGWRNENHSKHKFKVKKRVRHKTHGNKLYMLLSCGISQTIVLSCSGEIKRGCLLMREHVNILKNFSELLLKSRGY